MLPYIVPVIRNRHFDLHDHKKTRITLLKVTPVMAFLGVINPYGTEAMLYLWNSYSTISDGVITEMNKPVFMSMWGMIIMAFAILGVLYHIKHGVTPLFYMFAGTLLLSMRMYRNMWTMIICFVPFLSWWMSDEMDVLRMRGPERHTRPVKKSVVAVVYFLDYVFQ